MVRSMGTGVRTLTVAFLMVTACGRDPTISDPQVIYGADDRVDLYELAGESRERQWARSTVALIRDEKLSRVGSGYALASRTFGDSYDLCSSEPFRSQPNPAFCSRFLVAPDLIATAGHCIKDAYECSTTSFVFDFAYDGSGRDPTRVDSDRIYHCREIVGHRFDGGRNTDWAIVRLDRAVRDRRPFKVRRSGRVPDDAPLTVIGHPAGLPTKVAGGANVRDNLPSVYFVANLDTFGGNFGSAVINTNTGIVEGILVRGETDFVSQGSCRVSNRCTDGGCRGEDVTRASEFAHLIDDPIVPAPKLVHVTTPWYAIPDANTSGVVYEFDIDGQGTIAAATLDVAIRHPYIGDLELYLIHPEGTSILLHNRSGGSDDDIIETYERKLAPLIGKSTAGRWKFWARDLAWLDRGLIESLKLTLTVR